MTRWSLRRRLGGTQDAGREYRPVTEEPAAGQPPADQAPAGQPAPGPQAGSGWFEPDRGGPGQPGPAQSGTSPYGPGGQGAGQYGPGRPGSLLSGAGQYGAGPYGESQAGSGVAVLSPAPPPGPAQVADLVPAAESAVPDQGERADAAWPDICDQFGLHLLVLAEQLRASLDELEADEGDPDRLKRLYQVDHAVTRMRRASRDLRTLAGRSEEELAGFTTSLLDIIRMAASAIERYTQVTIGRVSELAVLGYAADDIGSVMAALLDNATRYSPGTVTVSGHLLEDGGVMFRIEDTGIGLGADQVAALNAVFAGPVPDVDERTGRHTGFPVVHRIARKHSIGVRLAARPAPSSGTVAMVTLPPYLLCEVPAGEAPRRAAPVPPPQQSAPQQSAPRPSAVPDLPRRERVAAGPSPWESPEPADRGQARPGRDLPRRERASLRGDDPRPTTKEHGMVPTAEQQAAARRAFADELSAFSLGVAGLPAAAGAGDTATEEEANP